MILERKWEGVSFKSLFSGLIWEEGVNNIENFYEYVHNTHDGRCFVTLTSQGDTSEHSASTRVLHLTNKTDMN